MKNIKTIRVDPKNTHMRCRRCGWCGPREWAVDEVGVPACPKCNGPVKACRPPGDGDGKDGAR